MQAQSSYLLKVYLLQNVTSYSVLPKGRVLLAWSFHPHFQCFFTRRSQMESTTENPAVNEWEIRYLVIYHKGAQIHKCPDNMSDTPETNILSNHER